MPKARHCAENERIKRRYLIYLKEAKGYSTPSIDMAASAIARFEAFTCHRDFKRFHVEQARAFKTHLCGPQASPSGSGKPLSKGTIASTLRRLKDFFTWLADQPGYRSVIRYADACYFTPLAQDERIAKGSRQKPVPEISEIEQALHAMPSGTPLEKRDRAVVAFILLSGARDQAVTGFKLKHVDLARGTVFQDAREVRTKRAKTFVTRFFPVGEMPLLMLRDWMSFLVAEMGFGPEDPVFPATHVQLRGMGEAPVLSLSRRLWSTTSPIREIFRRAFKRAGLPSYNPHSFRSTLARLGERICKTPEEFKAWSQNLGHGSTLVTFSSYGTVPEHRQCEIIAGLGTAEPDPSDAINAMQATLQRLRSRRS
jgi:integrase